MAENSNMTEKDMRAIAKTQRRNGSEPILVMIWIIWGLLSLVWMFNDLAFGLITSLGLALVAVFIHLFISVLLDIRNSLRRMAESREE